jgi:hypothetical protein
MRASVTSPNKITGTVLTTENAKILQPRNTRTTRKRNAFREHARPGRHGTRPRVPSWQRNAAPCGVHSPRRCYRKDAETAFGGGMLFSRFGIRVEIACAGPGELLMVIQP